jgi:hypothetical protein
LADVRDWEATAARYAICPRLERSVGREGRRLRFAGETELEAHRHLLRVRQRYVGPVDGVTVDESSDFVMRCWTVEDVRAHVADARFATFDVRPGSEAGVASDRLSVPARR